MKSKHDTRVEILRRLRSKRARGNVHEVTIGAHLSVLRARGKLTQAEYDFVMGIGDKKNEAK